MSRRSSTTVESSNSQEVSPISPSASINGKVQFDAAIPNDEKQFLQFHIITATLSEKASGKRPASSFVGMTVGKHSYTTSTVNGKESDPVWHDNLGPMWVKSDTKITFKLKSRSIPLVPAQTVATTKTYNVHELIDLQKDLYDRNCTIKLPLEFTSVSTSPPRNTTNNSSVLVINLRLPSSAQMATEEVARARARSNSIRLEREQQTAEEPQSQQRHGLTLKTSDIDSGEDLRLQIDSKVALAEDLTEDVVETIQIVPRITIN